MNLTKEELQQKATLLDTMNHEDILAFLGPYKGFRGIWIQFFWITNLLVLAALFASSFLPENQSLNQFITHISYGIALFFLVVPIHEAIHGLVYWYFGAKNILFRAEWRKLVVYAMADGFVASKKEFFWVAISPFLLINLSLLILILVLPNYTTILLGLLLMHCSGCIGDFALINYFHLKNQFTIVTYDDAAERKSYFYALKEDAIS